MQLIRFTEQKHTSLLNKLGDRNVLLVARRKEREEGESSFAECMEPAVLRVQRAKFRLAKGHISTQRESGGVPGGGSRNS